MSIEQEESLLTVFDQAKRFDMNDPRYEQSLIKILSRVASHESQLKVKEEVYASLARLYCKTKQPEKIQDLIIDQIDGFNVFTKTRAAKIIRQMIDQVAEIPDTEQLQIKMCLTLIEWCSREKKTYLKHKIQIRLATLYNQTEQYLLGIDIIDSIIVDVRKADDKHLLLEIYLIESKLNFGKENYSKAKASLTAARACANAIYCPPFQQAEIELMGGILHAEDKDYKTAYSYFYEAFEAFNSLEDPKALKSLKYMILTKIMTNNQEDVNQLLIGKHGLKYAGKDLEAMKAINQSYTKKSLIEFTGILDSFKDQITGDKIIKLHIESLYETLLERNLFSVIKPYSRVQVSFVAHRMQISEDLIQRKLSELILDKKIDGTLDQGHGCLILFDTLKTDLLYKHSLEVIKNMNGVVDKLFDRNKQVKV